MPDVRIDKGTTLDLLETAKPATSATSDMPVVETKPDAEVPKKPDVAAPVEGKKDAPDSAPAQQPADTAADDDGEPKKPAKGVQKRIDELTRQREDFRRQAEANEEMLRRTLAILEAAKQGPQAPQGQAPQAADETEPQRPARAQFADDATYADALENYHQQHTQWIVGREVNARLAEQHRRQMQAAIAQAQEQVRLTHAARVEKALTKFPDYSEIAESPDVRVSMPVAHAIMQSEQGPDLAYYLGSHKDEAARIFTLPPPMQLMELGLIAAKLSAAPSAPAAAPVSKAPPPAKPLTPSSETKGVSGEESMEDYAARRAKELRDERRPGARR